MEVSAVMEIRMSNFDCTIVSGEISASVSRGWWGNAILLCGGGVWAETRWPEVILSPSDFSLVTQ